MDRDRVSRVRENLEQARRNLQLMWPAKMLFAAFAFDVPIIVLIWQESGMSLAEVMLLQAIFSILLALFEVPSGYFADLVGRAAAVKWAAVGCLLGSIGYNLADGFWGFLVAETFLAFGFAFVSGADQALFYDSLRVLKRSHKSGALWGKLNAAWLWWGAAAGVVGGFAGAYNLRYPLLLTLGGSALLIVFALSFSEVPHEKRAAAKSHLGELMTIAFDSLIHNREVRWLLWFPAVLGAVMNVGLWMYQPYFELTKIPVGYFGLIFGLFNSVAAIGSLYGHRIVKWCSPRTLAMWVLGVIVMAYLLLGNFVFLFSFGFILFHQVVRGLMTVVYSDGLNRAIGSERRATILSLQSMLQRVMYAMLLVPVGLLADWQGIPITMSVLGLAALALGASFLVTLIPKGEPS